MIPATPTLLSTACRAGRHHACELPLCECVPCHTPDQLDLLVPLAPRPVLEPPRTAQDRLTAPEGPSTPTRVGVDSARFLAVLEAAPMPLTVDEIAAVEGVDRHKVGRYPSKWERAGLARRALKRQGSDGISRWAWSITSAGADLIRERGLRESRD